MQKKLIMFAIGVTALAGTIAPSSPVFAGQDICPKDYTLIVSQDEFYDAKVDKNGDSQICYKLSSKNNSTHLSLADNRYTASLPI
jgi:hypothetical protein